MPPLLTTRVNNQFFYFCTQLQCQTKSKEKKKKERKNKIRKAKLTGNAGCLRIVLLKNMSLNINIKYVPNKPGTNNKSS